MTTFFATAPLVGILFEVLSIGKYSKSLYNNNRLYLKRIYMLSIVAYLTHGPHKRLVVYCTLLQLKPL